MKYCIKSKPKPEEEQALPLIPPSLPPSLHSSSYAPNPIVLGLIHMSPLISMAKISSDWQHLFPGTCTINPLYDCRFRLLAIWLVLSTRDTHYSYRVLKKLHIIEKLSIVWVVKIQSRLFYNINHLKIIWYPEPRS